MQTPRFKHAVVIGGSGGIGRALVEVAAQRGAAKIQVLSRSMIESFPDSVSSSAIDILDEDSVGAAADHVAKSGPIDLVIVATGLLHCDRIQPEKSWRSLSSDVLAEYFAVNAIGPAIVAKHFLPLLQRGHSAVFACLSARVGSISDNRLGGWYGYRASKAALNMLVKTLAIELGRTRPDAICVALHPGTVDTSLSAPFLRSASDIVPPRRAANNLLDVIEKLTPQQSGGVFAWDGSSIQP